MQVNIVPIPDQWRMQLIGQYLRFNAKGKTTNDNPYAM